jgi:hypothetical protein
MLAKYNFNKNIIFKTEVLEEKSRIRIRTKLSRIHNTVSKPTMGYYMSVLCKKVFDPNPQPWGTKDAKEVAKKLIKTGAIRAIKSSIEKEKIKEEKINSGFKRSQVYLILDRLAWLLVLQKSFKLLP